MKKILGLIVKYWPQMVWLIGVVIAFILVFVLLVRAQVRWVDIGFILGLFFAVTVFPFAFFPTTVVVVKKCSCSSDDSSDTTSDDDEEDDYTDEWRQIFDFVSNGIESQTVSGKWNGSTVRATTKENISLRIDLLEGVRGWEFVQIYIEGDDCRVMCGDRPLTVEMIFVS